MEGGGRRTRAAVQRGVVGAANKGGGGAAAGVATRLPEPCLEHEPEQEREQATKR
jgi:hypothetical protein